jgi:hypothetical protein
MSFLRSMLRFFIGERGPADLVVTRNAGGTHFRLPHRHPHRRLLSLLLLGLLALGAYMVFLIIRGNLRLAEDERDLLGMGVCVAAIVLAMIAACFKLHVNWHYEVVLTPGGLAVFYVATGRQWQIAGIDLTPIRQFTVIARRGKSALLAESTADAPRFVLQNQDHDLMVRLANLLAEENARLGGTATAIRVRVEEVIVGTSQPRVEPPIHSKILLTQHEAGVTLEFPLPDDDRERARRRAWRAAEIGILLLIGSVFWGAICGIMHWEGMAGFAVPAFLVGIGLLIAAANMMTGIIGTNQARDDDLFQLSALGNLLIRTTRDHRKQIWYRDEIRDLRVEDRVETTAHDGDGGTHYSSVHIVQLMLELHAGDRVMLLGRAAGESTEDYRKKAELEWVATVLRQALQAEAPETPQVSPHAIQAANVPPEETRITG